MIRRPPRSTLDRSSAASDVYKRQVVDHAGLVLTVEGYIVVAVVVDVPGPAVIDDLEAVSYTHLRAHETVLDLVCRLLLEKKNPHTTKNEYYPPTEYNYTAAHQSPARYTSNTLNNTQQSRI